MSITHVQEQKEPNLLLSLYYYYTFNDNDDSEEKAVYKTRNTILVTIKVIQIKMMMQVSYSIIGHLLCARYCEGAGDTVGTKAH